MSPLKHLHRSASNVADPRSLLILLHGLGSDERDLMGMTGGIDPGFEIFSLRAPLAYEGGGYAWFTLGWDGNRILYNSDEAAQNMDVLCTEVVRLAGEQGIPAGRTVLGGFSQGAIMSLAVLLNHPEVLGGALLLSGAVIPELVPKGSSTIAVVPVLVHHGVHDPVLPVSLGRQVRELLVERGFDPHYREYPMGHGVSPESLADAEKWLSEFAARGSDPETN